jgi:hypothetical protein
MGAAASPSLPSRRPQPDAACINIIKCFMLMLLLLLLYYVLSSLLLLVLLLLASAHPYSGVYHHSPS